MIKEGSKVTRVKNRTYLSRGVFRGMADASLLQVFDTLRTQKVPLLEVYTSFSFGRPTLKFSKGALGANKNFF